MAELRLVNQYRGSITPGRSLILTGGRRGRHPLVGDRDGAAAGSGLTDTHLPRGGGEPPSSPAPPERKNSALCLLSRRIRVLSTSHLGRGAVTPRSGAVQAAQGSQSAVRALQEQPQTGKKKRQTEGRNPLPASQGCHTQSSRAGGCSCPSEGQSCMGLSSRSPQGWEMHAVPSLGFSCV